MHGRVGELRTVHVHVDYTRRPVDKHRSGETNVHGHRSSFRFVNNTGTNNVIYRKLKSANDSRYIHQSIGKTLVDGVIIKLARLVGSTSECLAKPQVPLDPQYSWCSSIEDAVSHSTWITRWTYGTYLTDEELGRPPATKTICCHRCPLGALEAAIERKGAPHP